MLHSFHALAFTYDDHHAYAVLRPPAAQAHPPCRRWPHPPGA